MSTIRIDVVSDLVCPWCYIGKRQLAFTLARWRQDHPDRPVEVAWRPYFLNPGTPPEGEPYRPFLEKKFGGPREVDAILARVAAAGDAVGIHFAFDKIRIRPTTLPAHRLIHHAQSLGTEASRTDQLVTALFVAGFEQGEDLGNHAVLLRIAESVGLDTRVAAHFLQSDAGVAEVVAQAEEATRIGIGGVPCFIFEQRLAVAGAQPPEQLRAALDRAAGLT